MEKELSEICQSILQLLDDHLIPTASTGESKVFYLKMKGDYHRYLAEFKTGADRKEAAEHTLLAYKAAQVRSTLYAWFAATSSFRGPVRYVRFAPSLSRSGRHTHSLLSPCARRISPWWTCPLHTPSALAWPLTSPSSITRF